MKAMTHANATAQTARGCWKNWLLLTGVASSEVGRDGVHEVAQHGDGRGEPRWRASGVVLGQAGRDRLRR